MSAASLDDGQLEFVIHRHASGGNGRGPTDGDATAVRGAVTIVPAMDRESVQRARALRPELALRRWHPLTVMICGPTLVVDQKPMHGVKV